MKLTILRFNFTKFSTFLLVGFTLMSTISCFRYTHTNLITLPPINYEHNINTLQIDGYFYYEDITDTGCYYFDSLSQKNVKRNFDKVKNINVIVLYADGGAYHSYGNFISKVDFMNCEFIDSLNTYEHVKREYEYRVVNNESYNTEIKSWGDRGVFTMNENEIKIQIYHGGGPLSSYSSILEYMGEIKNDTLINVWQKRDIRNNAITKVNMDFKFQKFEHKPNGNNPVLKNRHKFN